jgi:signal transduction histidine kinase
LFEELQQYDRVDIIYSNVASTFMESKLYNKSYRYNEKALEAARKLNDNLRLGTALSNFGALLSLTKKYDSAKLLLSQARELMKERNTDFEYMNMLLNTANVYLQTGEYKKLGEYARQAKQIADRTADSLGMVTSLYGLAHSRFFEKDFSGAEQMCKEALDISLRNGYKEKKQNFYELLSELAVANGDLAAYDRYNHLSNDAAEEEMNTTLQKNIQQLDKKYETEKKNNEIRLLNNDRKIKTLWNYILAGSFVTLLLLAMLAYRNYRHKQQLQQQRIAELEKEKQLLAAEAVLKGQEEERSRIAKDLHDGLGGMLSGVKYSFNHMKDNLIMTPENMQGFERGLDMLDSSINELRRVAHSMMPEALMKFGLNAALKDFCTSINGSGVLKVLYQPYGLEGLQVAAPVSVTIYRIVQELINNSIKHATASQAIVQLHREDNKLLLTVEDNGKGFDTQLLSQARGIGWSNIKNRLDYLKAKLDVQSVLGKGTSVNVEITV